MPLQCQCGARRSEANWTRASSFYCEVLGFEVMQGELPVPRLLVGGERQDPGASVPDGIDNAKLYYLDTPKDASRTMRAWAATFAFPASKPDGFIRFKKRGIDFPPRSLPESDLYQIFLTERAHPS